MNKLAYFHIRFFSIHRFRRLLLPLLVLAFSGIRNPTLAQRDYTKGQEFWVGYMKPNNWQCDPFIAILGKPGTKGTVETIYEGTIQSFKLPNSGYIEFWMPKSVQAVQNELGIKPNGIFPKGVHITADDSIWVLIYNGMYSDASDATLVKPIQALGYDYYVSSWFEPNKGNVPEYLVLATADNTVVSVQKTGIIDTTFVLMRGEYFEHQNLKHDFTGVKITSLCNSDGYRLPLAVFSGNAGAIMHIPNSDFLMTQLYPVEHWGKAFHIPILEKTISANIAIIASQNGTNVKVGSKNIQLNAGEFYKASVNNFALVTSNYPISVQLYSDANVPGPFNNLGGPYLLNLSPDDQGVTFAPYYYFDDRFSSSFGYARPSHQEAWILAQWGTSVTPDRSGITLGAFPFPSDPVYYMTGHPTIPPTVINKLNGDFHFLESKNGTFIAYVYSHEKDANTYGYTLGHNALFFETTFDIGYQGDTLPYVEYTKTICACDRVWFEAEFSLGEQNFIWDFGDGSTAMGKTVFHEFANGNYTVEVNVLDPLGCKRNPAIKYKLEVINCDIRQEPEGVLCIGDSVTLTSLNGSTFNWSTGDTTRSITVSPDSMTTYYLTVNNGTLDICDSIIVYVIDKTELGLNDSVRSCSNKPYVIEPGLTGKYLWSSGDSSERFPLTSSGKYWLQFTDSNGCTSTDTFIAQVTEPPVWHLEDQELDCDEARAILIPEGELSGGEKYKWATRDTTTAISVKRTGKYWLKVDDGICITSDTAEIFFSCYTFHAPNSFTPNNDGLNDEYRILGKGIEEFLITIQNRWGETVFVSSELNIGWDGSIRGTGKRASEGVYVYIAKTKDVTGVRHEYTGSITLIR